jgi:ElaB/YqjD/DUF883 family membrane-anchored ribosome-binding protein
MDPDVAAEAASAEAAVRFIDQQALSWRNVLSLKKQIEKSDEKQATLQETLNKMGEKAAKAAAAYELNIKNIEQQTQKLNDAKRRGDTSAIASSKALLEHYSDQDKLLKKTAGGQLKAQEMQAAKQKKALETELKLVENINKTRTVGDRLKDLFRSKETKQKNIDIARAKVGGGANVPGEGGEGGDGKAEALAAAGPYGAAAAALLKQVEKLKAPFKELGNQIKNAMMAPLAGAANLLTGEDFGMGGGKANASGATSILGGLSSILSKIPFIGGLLGGVVDMFKAMLDAVLGVEQANFRVGRALNISAGAADQMRGEFDKIANASDNVVVNSTRMLQSQVEISKQLGTNKQLSADILVNDVKLRDILGLEAESRQKIAESSIVTGRNATKLTQSVIGTVKSFNNLVGTSFKFNDIIGEASKMSGVMGLTFAKYPEKLTKAILSVKTLGFDLKQLDSTAESFLDFEGSISKEMEAQVLTGKDMNLTAAREAALNNDNAKLASEITKNIGDANTYLKMNRIQQEAIASSVGLSRDSLADILKKQEMYSKLGATDVKTFNQRIAAMEKLKDGQEQITKLIGKDAYNTYTQVSTAEKLTEIMERIKKTFVDFLRNSGLFEFITDPVKINNFIKGMADKLASTISMIGDIIASILEGISHLPFTDTDKWQGMAASVRSGSGNLAGSIRATTDSLGGGSEGSISGTKEKGARQDNVAQTKQASSTTAFNQPIMLTSYTVVDGQTIATTSTKYQNLVQGQTKD